MTDHPTKIDPTLVAEVANIATEAASTVGREILARRAAGFSWETKSTSTDVVTEIDTWAEATIVDFISERRPNDGFLGEEGTDSPGTTGLRWVIDPVDGTTNLLYDLVGYSVSIGVERNGESIAGAVYDPVRAELFTATRGGGAKRNGTPIAVSTQTELAHSLIATGFSYSPDSRREQAQALVEILPAVRDIRRFGGAALDLCAVACGRVDAYYELGLKPWDACAGALIAAEAGANVSIDALTIASSPGISDALGVLLDRAVT